VSKWEKVKIKDAFELQMGKTPSRNNPVYWNGGSNKWVTIADIGTEGKYIIKTKETISNQAVKESGIKIVPKGTVIMSFKLSIGKTGIVSDDMYTNEAIMAFIDRGKYKFENNYLYFLLRSIDWTIGTNKAVKGATLNKRSLGDFEIPIPTLETQKQIAKTLDTVSDLLAMRKQQLAELDNLIKSVFYDMFGDPATNDKGWDIGTIRDIVNEVKYGTSKPAQITGKYKYLRMNNITYEGEMDYSDIKYIDLPEHEAEKYLVKKGDVLFNRTNSKELVGKTAVFKDDTPMIIAGYIIRIRVNERADPEFLSAILNSKYGKETLYGMCKAIIGQANINAQELQDIRIFIPPIHLQKRFASIVCKIEEQKSLVKKAIDETQLLFDSLMSQYFDE